MWDKEGEPVEIGRKRVNREQDGRMVSEMI